VLRRSGSGAQLLDPPVPLLPTATAEGLRPRGKSPRPSRSWLSSSSSFPASALTRRLCLDSVFATEIAADTERNSSGSMALLDSPCKLH
jgi:hypothetical protein